MSKDYLKGRYSASETLRYNKISDESYRLLFLGIRHIKRLSNLKISLLLNKLCTDETLNHISLSTRHIMNLNELDLELEGQEGRTTEKGTIVLGRSLSYHKCLKSLRIVFPKCNPGDRGFEAISHVLESMSYLENLELSLGYGLFSNDGAMCRFVKSIGRLYLLKRLNLNLRFTKKSLLHSWLPSLNELPFSNINLEDLNLDISWLGFNTPQHNNNTDNHDLGYMLMNMKNLRKLTLNNLYGEIKQEDVDKVLGSNEMLGRLSMLEVNITHQKNDIGCLEVISKKLVDLVGLKKLNIGFWYTVDDVAVKNFSLNLSHLSTLVSLALDFNKCMLSIMGIQALMLSISRLKQLRNVEISCNRANPLPKLAAKQEKEINESVSECFKDSIIEKFQVNFHNLQPISDFISNIIIQLKHLHHLRINIMGLYRITTQNFLTMMNSIKTIGDIEYLDLHFPNTNENEDKWLISLEESFCYLKNLKVLKLNISSNSIKQISFTQFEKFIISMKNTLTKLNQVIINSKLKLIPCNVKAKVQHDVSAMLTRKLGHQNVKIDI